MQSSDSGDGLAIVSGSYVFTIVYFWWECSNDETLPAPWTLHSSAINSQDVLALPTPNHANSGWRVVLEGSRYVLGGHWQAYGRVARRSSRPSDA